MFTSKLSSIQKYGFGITVMSMVWLVVAWNENNITLDELNTMEGKVNRIEFQRTGKYLNDTVLYCTLDNGRNFYANNYLRNLNQLEFSEILRNAKKVKIWVGKNIGNYESIIPAQLVVDEVVYVDFNTSHSVLPDYFWFVIAALLFGTVLILEQAIRNILQHGRKSNL